MRQYRLHVLLGLVVLLFTSTALAEACRGSKISRAELQEYDAQAVLLLADQEAALRTHLPRGQPACPKLHPTTVCVVCYDPVAKSAVWVAYQLGAADVVRGPGDHPPLALPLFAGRSISPLMSGPDPLMVR